jgi:hypothetical protein
MEDCLISKMQKICKPHRKWMSKYSRKRVILVIERKEPTRAGADVPNAAKQVTTFEHMISN